MLKIESCANSSIRASPSILQYFYILDAFEEYFLAVHFLKFPSMTHQDSANTRYFGCSCGLCVLRELRLWLAVVLIAVVVVVVVAVAVAVAVAGAVAAAVVVSVGVVHSWFMFVW